MISILTKSPHFFSKENIKDRVKSILKIQRGPSGVLNGLISGLKKINEPFQINPSIKNISDTVNVLSGIGALKLAIKLKKKGLIKNLIAGPNLIILPTDYNKIICDDNIDIILVPSQWVKDLYSDITPETSSKIIIWSAGTDMGNINLKRERTKCIVYKKNVPVEVYKSVINELKIRNINFTLIEYGKFKKEDYFSLLEESRFMIYLQEAESQGLALQEAWARNVPTIVWNKGYITYLEKYNIKGNISAPYLNEKTGVSFKDELDFPKKLDNFIDNLENFNSHNYCKENLSDEVSAEKYVNIVKTLNYSK